MPVPLPEAPPRPDELSPPCHGCPDPDNAGRIDRPCPGPRTIEDPGSEAATIFTGEVPVFIRSLGSSVCADIVVCPRTGSYRTE